MAIKLEPTHEKVFDAQVRVLRALARDLMLGNVEHGTVANADCWIVPPHIRQLAGLPEHHFACEDACSRVFSVSLALGIAVGQLAPWIGADKNGAR